MNSFFAIDYGSRLAGTTAIAFFQPEKTVRFFHSRKKQDADLLITQLAEAHQPSFIFIDAPLSLPGVYTGLAEYADYFYRAADRKLGAMSPMFLGGLTARAMRLKATLEKKGVKVLETYPAVWAKRWELKKIGYKGKKEFLEPVINVLEENSSIFFEKNALVSWHSVDAFLALYAGLRYLNNEAETIGDPKEGVIII